MHEEEEWLDARKNKPKPGQILAVFRSSAKFIDGDDKRQIIELLRMGKAIQAADLMRFKHGAIEPDCYTLCRSMCEDMLVSPDEEVEKKPYDFRLELPFYTKRENVPQGDPHWETIQMVDLRAPTRHEAVESIPAS